MILYCMQLPEEQSSASLGFARLLGRSLRWAAGALARKAAHTPPTHHPELSRSVPHAAVSSVASSFALFMASSASFAAASVAEETASDASVASSVAASVASAASSVAASVATDTPLVMLS